MKAKAFDSKFDSGGKIVNQLDLTKARRIGTVTWHGWGIPSTVKRAAWA